MPERIDPMDPRLLPLQANAVTTAAESLLRMIAKESNESEAINQATEVTYMALEEIVTAGKYRTSTDCKNGCCWCCYQPVEISIPEAFRLAWAIGQLPDAGREEISKRVEESYREVNGLSYDELYSRNTRCPILKDGRCELYENRPLACRGMFSFSEAACKEGFDYPGDEGTVPVPVQPRSWSEFARRGLELASFKLKLQSVTVGLISALRLILNDESAFERWIAGEKLFKPSLRALRDRDEETLAQMAEEY